MALPSEDAGAFCRAVETAGYSALGSLTLVSPVARFPLARTLVQDWVAPGMALIGDAAHTVHPLAGQGVNLGFADVRNMVEVLRGRSRLSAIGDIALLRKYERAARESAWAVGELTDRLRGMYLSKGAVARWMRNEGMSSLNRLPPAKSLLINYASR
jgi:2-polyprenyl-6-methoxyphenol hydroxylase-like FAD-dependent oxidoreductase